MPIYSWEFASRARHSGGPGGGAVAAATAIDEQYGWSQPFVYATTLSVFGVHRFAADDLPVSGSSAITTSVVASRTSGDAPLYVFFDATGTTSSDSSISSSANGGTFRNIVYTVDYADSGGGNHSTTGLSRNVHIGGPLFDHVFEDPGTYNVSITPSHTGTSSPSPTIITITVSQRSNANTVVVGNGGVNDGIGPSGCTYQASISGVPNSTKRYLLRRTESFSISGGDWRGVRIDAIDSSGVIGKGGSGALPIISGLTVGSGSLTSDNAVSNCQVDGNLQYYTGQHNLFHRIVAKNPAGAQMCQTQEDGFTNSKLTCFSEVFADFSNITPSTSVGGYGFFLGFFVYGSLIACKTNTQYHHDIRIPHAYKIHVSHCQLPGVSITGGKHSLKINGGGVGGTFWDESTSGTDFVTQYVVVDNNILGSSSSTNDWTVEIGPQNGSGGPREGLADVLFEANTMNRGPTGSPNDLNANVKRLTYTGNVGGNVSTGSLIFATGGADATSLPSSGGPWVTPVFSNRM